MRRAFGTAVYGLLLIAGGAAFAAIILPTNLPAVVRGGSLLAAVIGIGSAHRELSTLDTVDKFKDEPWDAMRDEPYLVAIQSFAFTAFVFMLGLVIYVVFYLLGNLF
jgi:hypothetical protein